MRSVAIPVAIQGRSRQLKTDRPCHLTCIERSGTGQYRSFNPQVSGSARFHGAQGGDGPPMLSSIPGVVPDRPRQAVPMRGGGRNAGDRLNESAAVPVACPMGRETRGNSGETRGTRSVP